MDNLLIELNNSFNIIKYKEEYKIYNFSIVVNIKKPGIITKEFLDCCIKNNITVNIELLTKDLMFIPNNYKYFKHMTGIGLLEHKPIIEDKCILFRFSINNTNFIHKSKIKEFIKKYYEINIYKKFIYISIYNFNNTIIDKIFIEALINILSYKIPFIYINIEYEKYEDDDKNYLANIKQKYNNFIYFTDSIKYIYHPGGTREFENFILCMYHTKFREKTIYNKILYYFIMNIIILL